MRRIGENGDGPSWHLLLAALTAASSATVLAWHTISRAPKLSAGFALYYGYARALIEGVQFSTIYDPQNFNVLLRAYGFGDVQDMPNHPPTTAILLIPVAWLPPQEAKILWTVLSVGMLILAISILLRVFNVRLQSVAGLFALALVGLWHPLWDDLASGQVYCLILLLMSLCMSAFERRAGVRSGITLGLAMTMKSVGILAAIWFALNRKWKVFLAAIGVAIALGIIGFAWFGQEAWAAFVARAGENTAYIAQSGIVAYQSLNGFVVHFLTPSVPPQLVIVVSLLLSLLVFVWVIWYCQEQHLRSKALGLSVVLATGVLLSPVSEEFHFVLFLPLMIGFLATETFNKRSTSEKTVFLLACIVMAAPIRYKLFQASHFPMALFAYPRLFAGFVMVWLGVRACSLLPRTNLLQASDKQPALHP